MRHPDHDVALEQPRALCRVMPVKAGHALELTGMLILAMPGIVLATGFFLLFNTTVGLPDSADGIVIFTNALMAIPYALKVLENPMRDVNSRYSLLCQSLGMHGWRRLKVVELTRAKTPAGAGAGVRLRALHR